MWDAWLRRESAKGPLVTEPLICAVVRQATRLAGQSGRAKEVDALKIMLEMMVARLTRETVAAMRCAAAD